MPTYTYLGERTAIALPPEKEGDDPKEVALIPHQEIELPANLPYVQRLVALGLLKLVEAPKPASTKSRKEADS
ncbi:hypothetical protein [Leptolyngbya ohadii]|uniref:hypothetical protein n=1 Tax=Leptolyngbya ohadii TaxID=1962290 RepID=UPI000B59CC1A|nr:hypothetical protein [Leptolyngbya ohadii]